MKKAIKYFGIAMVSIMVLGAIGNAVSPTQPKGEDYAPNYGQYVGKYTTYTYPEAEPTYGLVEITGMNIYMMGADGSVLFSAKYTPREFSNYTALKTDRGTIRLYGNTVTMDAFIMESDGTKVIISKLKLD